MAIKNLTEGLNAGSQSFEKYLGYSKALGESSRDERRVAVAEALAEDRDLDRLLQERQIANEEKRTALADAEKTAKGLELASKARSEDAEREAALFRLQHAGLPPEQFQRDVQGLALPGALTLPLPFAARAGVAAAVGVNARQLLEDMDPVQAVRTIASAARAKAQRLAMRPGMKGAPLEGLIDSIDREAQEAIREALGEKVGGQIRNAQVQGLLASGEEDDGSALADQLGTLAALSPTDALKQLTTILGEQKKENAWLRYRGGTATHPGGVMGRSDAQYDEAIAAGNMDAARESDLAFALEDMRTSLDQKTFDEHKKRFEKLLSGEEGVRQYRVVTGSGSTAIEDPAGVLGQGKTTNRQAEHLLDGAAHAILKGSPSGSLGIEADDPGSALIAIMRAKTQAAGQLGMKRHPALVMADAVQAMEAPAAPLAEDLDDEERAEATAAGRSKRAIRIDAALQEAGVRQSVLGPEAQIARWIVQQGGDGTDYDRERVGPGFQLLSDLLVFEKERGTPISVDEAIAKIQADKAAQEPRSTMTLLPPAAPPPEPKAGSVGP